MLSTTELISYIDYQYLTNFIKNKLKDNKIIHNYDWKIFSNTNDNNNILYLINNIKKDKNFSNELLLLSLDIYTQICIKYAHQFDNYTYLFGIIYMIMNKYFYEECFSYSYYSYLLNIKIDNIIIMANIIEKFIDKNDIDYNYSNDYKKYIIN